MEFRLNGEPIAVDLSAISGFDFEPGSTSLRINDPAEDVHFSVQWGPDPDSLVISTIPDFPGARWHANDDGTITWHPNPEGHCTGCAE